MRPFDFTHFCVAGNVSPPGEIHRHVARPRTVDARLAVDLLDRVQKGPLAVVRDVSRRRARSGARAWHGCSANASTSAPTMRASCTQATPTPPLAPSTMTRSPALTCPAGDHHPIRGAVCERQRRGLLETDPAGMSISIDSWTATNSARPPSTVSPSMPTRSAPRMTGSIKHARAEPVRRPPPAERLDRARDIGTRDHRQPDPHARHAAAGEDVVKIHRGRRHTHQHLARRGVGIG